MKQHIQKIQQGFTLIELMIVVAIIGIIVSIALPIYSTYVAKSHFQSALGDIILGKTAMDSLLDTDVNASINTAEDIELQSVTVNCSHVTVDYAVGSDAHITCNMRSFGEQEVKLTRRDSDGGWYCDTDLDDALKNEYAGVDKCNDDHG